MHVHSDRYQDAERGRRSFDPMPRVFSVVSALGLEVELNREPHQTRLQDAGRATARASHNKRSD